METHLEVWLPAGPGRLPLVSGEISIGRDAGNDLVLDHDELVSWQHATLNRSPVSWRIRDLGSRNGTLVNGRLILSDCPLWHGSEILVGATRIVYRDPAQLGRSRPVTAPATRPQISDREQEVLLALCRPLLRGDLFTEPAPVRALAEELYVTEGAVKQHLTKLYGKFALRGPDRQRFALANAAVRTGTISIADLRAWDTDRRDRGA